MAGRSGAFDVLSCNASHSAPPISTKRVRASRKAESLTCKAQVTRSWLCKCSQRGAWFATGLEAETTKKLAAQFCVALGGALQASVLFCFLCAEASDSVCNPYKARVVGEKSSAVPLFLCSFHWVWPAREGRNSNDFVRHRA